MLGCSMNVKAKTLLHFLLPAVLKWVYSSGTSITIANDNWNLACRSSVTLTCRLQSVPLVAMTWYVNGIAATTCTSSSCSLTPEMPGHFIPTVENGTTYNLNINPIKLSDSQTTIYCSDGTDSPTGNVQVKVLANELTVTTQDIEDNKVNITALTNCVYSPMANVRFVLKYDANGDNTTFTNYGEVLDPKGVIKCSYVDNPDCGGNTTEKAIGETTIQKASTGSKGVSHNFKIAVLESSIERVTKYIGSYMIQEQCNDDQILCDNVCMVKCDCPMYKNTTECKDPWCAKFDYECNAGILGIVAGICFVVVCITLIKAFYDKHRNEVNAENTKSENQPTDMERMENRDQSQPIELRDSRYHSLNH